MRELEHYQFWVSGRPAPQGSKRHVGGGRLVEMSKAVGPWREAVRGEAQRVFPAQIEGPVIVTVIFSLVPPKTVKRKSPCVRPDIDKLARAVLDGLTMGGAFADDAQVTQLTAIKKYAPLAGAMITVSRADDSADHLAPARAAIGLPDNPFAAYAAATLREAGRA